MEVDREDHARTRIVEEPERIDDGQVLARIERFAVTSNNVTYAEIGHTLGYWDFFPPADAGWGRVPAFGYAEIIASRSPGVAAGTRLYGYLPMSSHVVLEPGRVGPHALHDTAAHRQPMSEVYNRYAITDSDPLHDGSREPQRMLLHPLFMTAFVIDDFFHDHDDFGTDRALISSASSKTAIGVAHRMRRRGGIEVVGLTSPSHLDFVVALDCYDRVVLYDTIDHLEPTPAVYIDISGSATARRAVHERFGDELRFSSAVGLTDWDDMTDGGGPLPGPAPELFFAPTQLKKRTDEWGRAEMERRANDAWTDFSAWTDGWLRIEEHWGAEPLDRLWTELRSGRVDPAVGHVVSLSESP